jgi:hypothetical protein
MEMPVFTRDCMSPQMEEVCPFCGRRREMDEKMGGLWIRFRWEDGALSTTHSNGLPQFLV